MPCLVFHRQKQGIELWADDFSIISYPSIVVVGPGGQLPILKITRELMALLFNSADLGGLRTLG